MLTAMPTADSLAGRDVAADALTIGIQEIQFPEYLRRPQIVTRSSPNKLEVAEFDRWGEPVEANFGGVLAENLTSLLSGETWIVQPWRQRHDADFVVVVRVIRFDVAEDGNAILRASWDLNVRGDSVPAQRHITELSATVTTEKQDGKEYYEAVTVAMSALIADLSREIAVAIERLR
jgi:uncharacterized lipoprotein YmbA